MGVKGKAGVVGEVSQEPDPHSGSSGLLMVWASHRGKWGAQKGSSREGSFSDTLY